MKASFNYEEDVELDGVFECEVTYEISKHRPGNYFEPPEGGEIEIISIKQNEIEIEVSQEIFDRIMICAEDHANNNNEDPYDYDRDKD
jgi:hypothetical protein